MSKAALRARIRAQRRARTESDLARCALHLAEAVTKTLPEAPARVTCYRSLPTEPGTEPLVAALLAAGHDVWLPRIDGPDLRWVPIAEGTSYAAGPMGILEPEGAAVADLAQVQPDVILLPGLAVDAAGNRLGQGGGFYDRALAPLPQHSDGGPLRVALLFDEEVLERVPTDEHDCTVDVVITPDRVVRFG
ncbi:MAG: 5-formyltetrahydrofolate cyclo-ligase [Actinobacteria bacterium]|nr:5-formyltetrahydrofolate cyclo-ligase [Actinomycetota bacterium]